MTNDRSQLGRNAGAGQDTWERLVAPEDTRELLSSARTHFAKLFPSSALLELHAGTVLDASVWGTLIEHGYTSLGLPEDLDGLGTLSDAVMLAEEIGLALLPLPLATTIAALHTALIAGLTPPDPTSPSAIVVADSAPEPGMQVEVPDAGLATHLVTVSPHRSGATVAVVEVAASTTQSPALDLTRPPASVTLGTVLEHASIALPGGVDHALAAARTVLASELLGVAMHSFEGALEHARTRVQFGRPIGSFQAVKHQLADVHVAIERSRSLVYGAAAEIASSGPADRTAYLSMLAKASAAETATEAVRLRTQLLGAMGLTAESDNHLAIRRAHQLGPVLGIPSDLYMRAAELTIAEATTDA